MPIKVEGVDGVVKNIPVDEYRERRARAFRFGTMGGAPVGFVFFFERDEYQRGVDSTSRIKQEIADGLR